MPQPGKQRFSVEQLCGNLHKLAGILLRSAGFKLTRWGPGELKIGIWRKALRGGQPRTFLLVPGFGDSPASWLPVLTMLHKSLGRHYTEAVLIEFPGYHGYLFNERSFPSLDSLLDVFLPAMDQIGAHSVLGHSLGGGMAAYYAGVRGRSRIATSIERMFLISPSGIFTDRELRDRIEQRIQLIAENGIECLRDIRPGLVNGDPNWVRKLVSEFFKFSSGEELRQFVHSFRDEHFLGPLLPHIHANVELIWGSQDRLIPPTVIPLWLSGLTQFPAQAITIDGVGHAPQLEAPRRLSQTLHQLIERPPLGLQAADAGLN